MDTKNNAAGVPERLRESEVADIAMKHAGMYNKGEYYEFDAQGLDAFAMEIMDRCRAPASAKPVAPADERALFEAWFAANKFGGMRESMWAAWQARAALASQPGALFYTIEQDGPDMTPEQKAAYVEKVSALVAKSPRQSGARIVKTRDEHGGTAWVSQPGAEVPSIDPPEFRKLVEFWGGKFFSGLWPIRNGHEKAYAEIVAHINAHFGQSQAAATAASKEGGA